MGLNNLTAVVQMEPLGIEIIRSQSVPTLVWDWRVRVSNPNAIWCVKCTLNLCQFFEMHDLYSMMLYGCRLVS